MLLYSTRTAVFKNGDKSVLLCKITLPTGAEDTALDARIVEYYKAVYNATHAAAKEYAETVSPEGNRLYTLTVSAVESVKNGRLTVKRTYKITGTGGVVAEKTFTDKFPIKCDKTKKYSIKERQKYNK